MEIPKKIPSISGNGNSKKLLLFQDMELLSSSSKYKKKSTLKKVLIFCYILEKGTF